MSIEVSFQRETNYLFVKARGEWTEENMREAMEAIRNEATKEGLTHLLLDLREIPRPDNEMTRYFTGEHCARILCPPFKSAVLAMPEVYNKFAESVAVGRGAIVKVFFEKEGALEWLLGGATSRRQATRVT